jgi:alkylation response protein AidB-like acyl-CoA dehydrogenase
VRVSFTDEQDILRDAIRGALARDAGLDKVRRWSDADNFAAFDVVIDDNAWDGIGVAEDLGGQGGGLVEQAILFEELGRAGAPSGSLLVSALAAALGLANQGQSRATIAIGIESGNALDQDTLEILPRENRITARIPLVLNALQASRLVIPCKNRERLTLWSVDLNAAGVLRTPRRLVDRTRQFGDIDLRNANAVEAGDTAAETAVTANARAAILVAAESVGLSRRMLAMTVEYVGQRVQFGVPVGSFQAVKHAAAEALVDIEAAHSGVYYAAWALQHGESDALMHSWIAKAYATEAAVRTADRALSLHGAIGYTWDYDLQLFYKRAKANMELLGSPRTYRERIAAALALH